MAGHLTTNTANLIRGEVWSNQLKTLLQDQLYATRWIRWITDFPDGDLIHIPSVGAIESQDYVEGQEAQYTALDTGDFTFQVTEYKQAGTYISNKFRQDSYYVQELESQFVPQMHRSLAVDMEKDALRVGPEAQTAGNANEIEGVAHRFVATGANNTLSIADFARVRSALQKAQVPMNNLIAIVDPSVEFQFNTLANFTNMIYNPMWEGIVTTGVNPTGLQFKVNIFGFDVYVSNYLSRPATETIYGQASGSDAVANLFFSADSTVLPFIGAIRQAPNVETEYNKDYQRTEYLTTCRYGMKLFREENLVTVLSSGSIPQPTYS